MQTKEAIEKVLDALGDNPEVAKSMENDVEGTLRTLVGNEVSEQDFANQEALRLSGVFNTPIPAQPPEREKALDKVKEPPRICRSLEREER